MQQAARWLRVLLGLFVCLPGVAQAGTIASGNHYTVLVKPEGARDKTISKEERERYKTEEKARRMRNQRKWRC